MKQERLKSHMTHIHNVLLECNKTSLYQLACNFNNWTAPKDLWGIIDCNTIKCQKTSAMGTTSTATLKAAPGGIKVISELHTLKNCINFLLRNRKLLSTIDWNTITNEEFEDFIPTPDNSNNPTQVQIPLSTSPTNTINNNGQGQKFTINPADLFCKNVWHDPTLFPK